jgi:hypothetical protein
MNACKLQQLLQKGQPFFSHDITRLVMTFADPSAGHKDTVGSSLKSFQHIMRRYRSGAHDPNRPDRCGILHSTDPSQVSRGVSSPRAQECNDLGLKIIRHRLLPLDICRNRLSSAMSPCDLTEIRSEARIPKHETISKS